MAEARTRKSRKRGLPRGPQALPPEEVAADQRERLYEATIRAVNERGFVATTISDLVAGAGVSRRSFYEHFENKEECLLATYDVLIERLVARIAETYHPEDEWRRQIEGIVRAVFEASSDRPDAARLVSVEMGAAGPVGIERWARNAEQLAHFISGVFERAPGEGTIPSRSRERSWARCGRSCTRACDAAAEQGAEDRTPEADPRPRGVDRLLLPCEGIPMRPRSRRHRQLHGRARSGDFTLPAVGPKGTAARRDNLPKGFVAHNQRERIFDAVANLTAEKGYPALSLEEIVAEAAISLQTFYEHFESKEEAFLATFEIAHSKAMAAVNRSLNLRLSWAQNVKVGLYALLEIIASEPSAAKLACVDILIAYPHMRAAWTRPTSPTSSCSTSVQRATTPTCRRPWCARRSWAACSS